MKYLLALDQSTVSARALVIDHSGNAISVAQKEITQIYPQPGWVEHDPNEIWSAQIGVAADAISRANIGPKDIAAVGVTNQRETTVIWDRKTSQPIANAIVWQDRRTSPMCETMKADGLESFVRRKTGLVIDAYFSGTKVRWLLDHVPGARDRAERGELAFGTIDSWLIWKLTEGRCHVTDETNASRTMFYNIRTRMWDDHLLNALGIPRLLLPEVKSSSEVYGETTGTLPGIPIAGNAGDQQAALFGHMCNQPGMVKKTNWSPRSRGASITRRSMPLKEVSLALVPLSNGCVTVLASSALPMKLNILPRPLKIMAGSILCRPSPVWARLIGIHTHRDG